MKKSHVIGLIILTLAWVALCWVLVELAGITLRIILVVILSGILVFLPLYKKFRHGSDK